MNASKSPLKPSWRWLGSKRMVLLIGFFLSFFLSALILRRGVTSINSDAWAYWQGSVNLLEHGRYISMLGEPITGWPPGFPFYLALFQMVFSQTGWALIWPMCLISGLVTVTWFHYVFKVFSVNDSLNPSPALIGSLIFVLLFSLLCCIDLQAHALLLVLIGLLFNCVSSHLETSSASWNLASAFAIGLILMAAFFVHNSALIYLAATLVVIAWGKKQPLLLHVRNSLVILLVSLPSWLWVRHLLHQEKSHSVGGIPYSPLAYLGQIPEEIGVFFISSGSVAIQTAVGAILIGVALILLVKPALGGLTRRHGTFLALAFAALAGHYAIFNLVAIGHKLGGRFTWFMAFALLPLLLFAARDRRGFLVILLFLSVGISGWRVSKFAWKAAVPALMATQKEQSPYYIHSRYFLTSLPNKPLPEGCIRIKTPIFPWEYPPSQAREAKSLLPEVILLPSPPNAL